MSDSNIQKAILAVYHKVEYVQKTGQHPQYKFASEADFIAALRPAMIAEGIICTPLDITNITPSQGVNAKGTAIYHITAKYTYRLTHAPSGTYMDVCSLGEGIDTGGDKASYKTSTGAQKYALRQSFMIETGTDPENHEEEKKAESAPARVTTPIVKQPIETPENIALLKESIIKKLESLEKAVEYAQFVEVAKPNLKLLTRHMKNDASLEAEMNAIIEKTKNRLQIV